MRSVRRLITVATAAGVASVAVSGCGITSTQDKAARIQISSARTRAEAEPVKVGQPSSTVSVSGEQLIRSGEDAAFVVTLRNDGSDPTSDLPLVVGVQHGGKTEWVNTDKKTPYFQNHTPALAPGAETIWVYDAEGADIPDGKPLAKVGSKPTQEPPSTDSVPSINATAKSAKGSKGPVTVEVTNGSDIPQYGLEAYVLAGEGPKYSAAGVTQLDVLDAGASTTGKVDLIGDPGKDPLRAQAPPTILK